MRIRGKIAVIAVCFGVFLLLYFLGGNAADDPPLKEVGEVRGDTVSPPPPVLRRDVAAKFTKKPPAGGGDVRAGKQLGRRKAGKATSRGASVAAKG